MCPWLWCFLGIFTYILMRTQRQSIILNTVPATHNCLVCLGVSWLISGLTPKKGIRPVWSNSFPSAWRKLWSLATHWAHGEDFDQTAVPRLIWVFAGRTCQFVGFVICKFTCKHYGETKMWANFSCTENRVMLNWRLETCAASCAASQYCIWIDSINKTYEDCPWKKKKHKKWNSMPRFHRDFIWQYFSL